MPPVTRRRPFWLDTIDPSLLLVEHITNITTNNSMRWNGDNHPAG